MSKRYIFFIGTLCNGGAERVVSILSSRMAEQGMEVEVLTYYDKPVFYEVNPKVQITSVEKLAGRTNKLLNIFWLRKYFKEHAKVVISFLAPFNIVALAAKIGIGIPIIVADRNDPTKVPSNAIVRKIRDFLYMFADGVVVQTEKNKSYFNQTVQKKSVVIYNPINLGKCAGAALNTQKERRIVTAGRLMPQKNQKMLIKAFAEIVKQHPDYELVIYGEGPSRNDLEELIRELQLQQNVSMPGNIADLHERMKTAEMFVLSSDYEGMPNALIEAMALGLPSVSTKVSGATDLIEHNKNGLLIEVNEQAQLKAAMLDLIENQEKRSFIAENAVELNRTLELSLIMEQWIKFIKNCTA